MRTALVRNCSRNCEWQGIEEGTAQDWFEKTGWEICLLPPRAQLAGRPANTRRSVGRPRRRFCMPAGPGNSKAWWCDANNWRAMAAVLHPGVSAPDWAH